MGDLWKCEINPQKVIMLAKSQQDTFIDDGNSRTYFNVWLFAQSDR